MPLPNKWGPRFRDLFLKMLALQLSQPCNSCTLPGIWSPGLWNSRHGGHGGVGGEARGEPLPKPPPPKKTFWLLEQWLQPGGWSWPERKRTDCIQKSFLGFCFLCHSLALSALLYTGALPSRPFVDRVNPAVAVTNSDTEHQQPGSHVQ